MSQHVCHLLADGVVKKRKRSVSNFRLNGVSHNLMLVTIVIELEGGIAGLSSVGVLCLGLVKKSIFV